MQLVDFCESRFFCDPVLHAILLGQSVQSVDCGRFSLGNLYAAGVVLSRSRAQPLVIFVRAAPERIQSWRLS
jgi:hypothetical protein